MHSEEVIITLSDGPDGETQYVFHERERCLVGRADDCDIRIPSDWEHLEVSRHHCQLQIDPPKVYICDLGSTNGTFVNGVNIGQGQASTARAHKPIAANRGPQEFRLRNGDEIVLGHTGLRLAVVVRSIQLQSV